MPVDHVLVVAREPAGPVLLAERVGRLPREELFPEPAQLRADLVKFPARLGGLVGPVVRDHPHEPLEQVECRGAQAFGHRDAPLPADAFAAHRVRQLHAGDVGEDAVHLLPVTLGGLRRPAGPFEGPVGRIALGQRELLGGDLARGEPDLHVLVVAEELVRQRVDLVHHVVVVGVQPFEQRHPATSAAGGPAVVLLDLLDVRAVGLAGHGAEQFRAGADRGGPLVERVRHRLGAQRFRVGEDQEHHPPHRPVRRHAVDGFQRLLGRRVDQDTAVDREPAPVAPVRPARDVTHVRTVRRRLAAHRDEARLEGEREARTAPRGQRELQDAVVEGVRAEVVPGVLIDPVVGVAAEAEAALVNRLGQRLAQVVVGDGGNAAQQGRGDPEVDRALVGLGGVEVRGQPREGFLEPGEEELVALEEAGGFASERGSEQLLHPALLGPEVAEPAQVRLLVDLGQGQGRPVDAARRRAGDDVRSRGAADQVQQRLVGRVRPGQTVQLEYDAAHPDGQADAAVQDDGEPDLFSRHGLLFGHVASPPPAPIFLCVQGRPPNGCGY